MTRSPLLLLAWCAHALAQGAPPSAAGEAPEVTVDDDETAGGSGSEGEGEGDGDGDDVAVAAPAGEVTEEEVDFDEEEQAADAESKRIIAQAGGGGAGGGGGTGFKLFVDLLADYRIGQTSWVFRPNHTYVFLMASLTDEVSFILHVSDDPIFFELEWQALPSLSLKLGKLLVPFGTNNFHHLIGGRVDELSHFLPETWGDFGLSLTHAPLDEEWIGFEYTLYGINGLQGGDEPVFAAGTGTDNNWAKGLGARSQLTFFGSYVVTGSAYFDVWDAASERMLLFYALGAEGREGFLPLPIVDRLSVRGEWARGEIQLLKRNYQQGILPHAVARAGFYLEAQARVWETLRVRVRGGRINPSNVVSNEEDLWLLEPALVWWMVKDKVQLTVAYQLLHAEGLPYDPRSPADVVYGKIFLQF